jgi:hypothetical protein
MSEITAKTFAEKMAEIRRFNTVLAIDAQTAVDLLGIALPSGTRAMIGRGIAAVTDEPERTSPRVGDALTPDIFDTSTTGVGYSDTPEEAVRLAVADYEAKRK